MCSLMEKDVLIEEVSATAAFICKKVGAKGSSTPEFLRCTQLRDLLYLSTPETIDASAIRSELAELRQPFL